MSYRFALIVATVLFSGSLAAAADFEEGHRLSDSTSSSGLAPSLAPSFTNTVYAASVGDLLPFGKMRPSVGLRIAILSELRNGLDLSVGVPFST